MTDRPDVEALRRRIEKPGGLRDRVDSGTAGGTEVEYLMGYGTLLGHIEDQQRRIERAEAGDRLATKVAEERHQEIKVLEQRVASLEAGDLEFDSSISVLRSEQEYYSGNDNPDWSDDMNDGFRRGIGSSLDVLVRCRDALLNREERGE